MESTSARELVTFLKYDAEYGIVVDMWGRIARILT